MNTYHEFLRQRFVEKQEKNKGYSMRAFAGLIGLTPGGASRLLRGQMGLSLERAQEIALRLKFSEKETEHFMTLLQLFHAKSSESKERALSRLENSGAGKIFDLSVDHFKTISHWVPMAILRITAEKDLDRTVQGISKKLKISSSEALSHLIRLERLELIQPQLEGTETHYVRISEDEVVTTFESDHTAAVLFYRSVLEQVEQNLVHEKEENRAFDAHVLALDRSQLPEARRIVEETQRKLLALAKKGKKDKKIYQSFFAVFELKGPRK